MHFFKLLILAGALKAQLFFVGDSITFGIGTTGYGASGSNVQGVNSFPQQTYALLKNTKLTLVKRGYPGVRADNYASSNMASDLLLVDNTNYRRQIVVIFWGANDIATYTDAAAILTNIKAVHAAYRAKGCKTVVVTVMNRIDAGKQVDTQRQALNTLIRQDWATFADDIADLSAQPLLDATTAPQNAAYFAANDVDGLSGVHLTDAGAALLAAEVAKPIQRLLLVP
ncbi:MAG: Lysophospholipase [Spirosoma sp.]|nr:Lysophospholipase [Spirosoma sp.]